MGWVVVLEGIELMMRKVSGDWAKEWRLWLSLVRDWRISVWSWSVMGIFGVLRVGFGDGWWW